MGIVAHLAATPGFGHFDIAVQFEINGVLSGFRDGSGTVCFQQLATPRREFRPHGSLSSYSVRSRHGNPLDAGYPCVKSPGFNPRALTATSGSGPHASTLSFGAITAPTIAFAFAGSCSAT
ncbi:MULTISPECIES: hypothetical protein [Bradyrhizobium]|jgi:hypothetical protein|uniref:hypothetical protein n=1 Tax=Bradyrhizobium TaxID=374 RepID=UPI0012FE005A